MELRYKEFGILYVDDEAKSLKYFHEIFEDIAPIYTAHNADEGFRLFEDHRDEIGVIISDQRMPGQSGISFLERVREIDERPLRMLVTAFTDLNMAVDALNCGLLYSYLTKPWEPDELGGKLSRALENFSLKAERDELLRDKAAAFQQLMMAEKAATIGVLSSGLNHHMRNALTVIQPFFDMIPGQLQDEIGSGMSPKDTFFWSEYYQDVGQQLNRITAILSNLSEGTGCRCEEDGLNRREEVDVAELMESASIEVLGGDSSITFNLHKEEGLPVISADDQKISRMAHLLLQEARMNIEKEGVIEVIISHCRANSFKEGAVRVKCTDNGKPISDSDRKRLFDPFYVRANRPSEVGMNLMTCYLTVFQHGGTIKATGDENGRNTIELTLPVETAEPLKIDLLGHLSKDSTGPLHGDGLRTSSFEIPVDSLG